MNMNHDSNKKVESSHVRSVAKALCIVDLLAIYQRGMTLGEIASEMHMAKSTLYGLLSTLRDFGYVEQSDDGKYRLGIRLFEVGHIVADSWNVRKVASAFYDEIINLLGETIHLAVMDQGQVLYIDKKETQQSLRIVSQVGSRLPAHCTGVGKVMLADLSKSELKQIISRHGLIAYTSSTITDPYKIEEELNIIRYQGYAIDKGEIMEGLSCVAVPIRDHSGKVCAGLSVSGPSGRLNEEKLNNTIRILLQKGREISIGMGYRETRQS